MSVLYHSSLFLSCLFYTFIFIFVVNLPLYFRSKGDIDPVWTLQQKDSGPTGPSFPVTTIEDPPPWDHNTIPGSTVSRSEPHSSSIISSKSVHVPE